MTCDTLIKPVFAKYAESRCEAAFEVFPLLVLVFEFGRSWEPGHLDLGLGFTQTRLERGFGGGAVVPVALSLSACCCGWGHCSFESAFIQLLRILWVSGSKIQERVRQKINYANLFIVENNMRGLDDLGARMTEPCQHYHRRYKHMNFRIASRQQPNEHLECTRHSDRCDSGQSPSN